MGQDTWSYTIVLENEIIRKSGREIIGTGRLESVNAEKPAFSLGELVNFRFASDESQLRTVLGLQLINDLWIYTVEFASPTFAESDGKLFTSDERKAWVVDCDLASVRV